MLSKEARMNPMRMVLAHTKPKPGGNMFRHVAQLDRRHVPGDDRHLCLQLFQQHK
jgi:hypothetical protein